MWRGCCAGVESEGVRKVCEGCEGVRKVCERCAKGAKGVKGARRGLTQVRGYCVLVRGGTRACLPRK